MASILVAFVCIASMLTVSEGTLQASVSPVERRNLRHSAWQNPQVYTQKCPGDRDWYSQKPRNFWNLYRSYCDPKHLPINQWGNFSEMILDQEGISGFGSYSQFYTGRVSMKIKLPCTNSSGTVFAFYVSTTAFFVFYTRPMLLMDPSNYTWAKSLVKRARLVNFSDRSH